MASKRLARTRRRRYEQRQVSVRSVRRDPPDIRKLSKALIALAMAEAEHEAQAEQQTRPATSSKADGKPKRGGAANA